MRYCTLFSFVALLGACDQAIDEDVDGDGVLGWADCDDADASIGAPSPEICNGVDDDCNGIVDDGAMGADLYFPDADGDGFGELSQAGLRCSADSGWSRDAGDCDDADPDVFPGAPEVCNKRDDDCDGRIDQDATDATLWYVDFDRDGFGGDRTVWACDQPRDYVMLGLDCNDFDFYVHPDADELCNLEDDDCDGEIDEDLDCWT